MIKFADLPTVPAAADNLYETLLKDLGTGPYTPDELRKVVDEGCAISIAIMKSIDVPMAAGAANLPKNQHDLVQMVALTMTLNTLRAAIDVAMMESFLTMFLGPPSQD